MKCYCVETNDKFIYCVENAENKFIKNIEAAWFKWDNDKYIKEYSNNFDDKEIIKNNFPKLGEELFKSKGNWKESLKLFAKKCYEYNIKWYITGSVSEAVMGVEIIPHDIDIFLHERDYLKIKDLFLNCMIEILPIPEKKPFSWIRSWPIQHFGRFCINGILFEIVADKNRDTEEHYFNKIMWEGYLLNIEKLETRYEIEKQRNRTERIKKIEEYMEK
jgi:hypothetical protein